MRVLRYFQRNHHKHELHFTPISLNLKTLCGSHWIGSIEGRRPKSAFGLLASTVDLASLLGAPRNNPLYPVATSSYNIGPHPLLLQNCIGSTLFLNIYAFFFLILQPYSAIISRPATRTNWPWFGPNSIKTKRKTQETQLDQTWTNFDRVKNYVFFFSCV